MLNNDSLILNMTEQALSRDRRGTRDHIGHLISVPAVPALGTSLFVVSAYLHAHRGGALQRPGKIFSNQNICNSRSFQYYKWTRNYSRTSVELTLFGVVFWLQNIIQRSHQKA